MIKYLLQRKHTYGGFGGWEFLAFRTIAAALGETTVRNQRLIREARERRGDAVPWAQQPEDALLANATKLQAASH